VDFGAIQPRDQRLCCPAGDRVEVATGHCDEVWCLTLEPGQIFYAREEVVATFLSAEPVSKDFQIVLLRLW